MPEDVSKIAEEAVNEFTNGLYCSEAILKAFNKNYNLGLNDTALKIASGFGAGLGGSKCCCGSLSGAVMVLSALKGRTVSSEEVDELFRLTSLIHDRFKERYKASCCRVLTKNVEWGTPAHHKYCEQFVRGAAEILEEILHIEEVNVK